MQGSVIEFRRRIKRHEDILTVPEEINRLYKEHEKLGYKMHIKLSCAFSYYLEDGTAILVYWQKGHIYEAVVTRQKRDQAKLLTEG